MTITVLGGSPKGATSVTMQYVDYLRRRYPAIEFDVRQPAIRIRKLEADRGAFDAVVEAVRAADAVLWAFPLYVHGVCSQYQRFIELIRENDAAAAFAGKPTAALCTSIHFFDNTAQDYIRSVCEDLEMAFVAGHPAKMDDLTTEDGRRSLEGFFGILVDAARRGAPVTKVFPAVPVPPAAAYRPVSPPPAARSTGKRITIIADSLEDGVGALVDRFRSSFADPVTVVDLSTANIGGGCLGCLKCGPKNACAWDGKDEVRSIYETHVETADLLVYAARIRSRWHSARLKAFVDRGFFHTHQPFLTGKQFAVLLEGSIAAEPALRDFFTAFPEWQGASLQGIVDTAAAPDSVDASLDDLAARCALALETDYRKPVSFLGLGGMKVFRDDIYGHLGMVFRADHRSYRRSGLYRTMPHKRPLRFAALRLTNLVLNIPPIQKRMIENMRTFMLMPYRQALEAADAAARADGADAGGLPGGSQPPQSAA